MLKVQPFNSIFFYSRPAALLVAFFCHLPGTAQPFLMPFTGSSHYARQLDALRWTYAANISLQREGTTVFLENTWNSNLFLLDGKARNVQDENRFKVFAAVPLRKPVRLTADARQFSFSAGDVEQWSADGGVEVQFLENSTAALSAGLMSDRRNNIRDQGALIRAGLQAAPPSLAEFDLRPVVRAAYSDLGPRSFATVRMETPLRYAAGPLEFSGQTFRTFDVRESYQAINFLNRNARDAVESIRTDTTGAFVSLYSAIGTTGTLRLDSEIRTIGRSYSYRKFDPDDDRLFFDTGFRSRRADIDLQTRWKVRNVLLDAGGHLGISADEASLQNEAALPPDQVRRRQEILENSVFYQNRLETRAGIRSKEGSRSPWSLQTAVSILRHNTPDANPDDRDEQQLSAAADVSFPVSPFLNISTRIAAERFRFVFINSVRSAENNDRHSLRLLPSVSWTPTPNLLFAQQLVLRANYTVYRFPDAAAGIGNQSAREYGHRTDITWRFTGNWMVHTSIQRNELRIGRLYWRAFKETPLDTLVTWDIALAVTRQFRSGWVSAGFRGFSKRDFMPIAVNRLDLPDSTSQSVRAPGRFLTRQFGPTVDIRFPFHTRHELFIKGWYQWQTTEQMLYTTYSGPLAAAYLRNETRYPRRFFPNLEIMARLRF